MTRFFHAILAYLLIAALLAPIAISHHAASHAAAELSPPQEDNDTRYSIPVSFTLTDRSRITGTLTDWSESSFTGTFGRRDWNEITYQDAWRILNRLIDRDIPDDWLLIARIMLHVSLDQDDAADWAERAFRHARRVAGENEIDAIEKRIREIRSDHEATKQAHADGNMISTPAAFAPARPKPMTGRAPLGRNSHATSSGMPS
jgi:hypothetical protein